MDVVAGEATPTCPTPKAGHDDDAVTDFNVARTSNLDNFASSFVPKAGRIFIATLKFSALTTVRVICVFGTERSAHDFDDNEIVFGLWLCDVDQLTLLDTGYCDAFHKSRSV
jgi:hypothetical protein